MTMRCFVLAVLAGVSVSGVAEILTDDPAIVSTAGTYAEPFTGTGENAIVFKGSGTKIFTSSKGVEDFASVKVEDGQVWGQANGVTILHDGDISLETARIVMNYPKDATTADWTMSCAASGTIRFGADSVIEVRNRSSGSGNSTLNLGRLRREDSGGTLLFSARCNNGNYFGYSYLGGRCKIFPAGYSDGEELPAYMAGGCWNTSSSFVPLCFLRYTASGGVVPIAGMQTDIDAATINDVLNLTAATNLAADIHVKGVRIDNSSTLTIPSGTTLTVGDGENPAGIIFNHKLVNNAVNANLVAGAGEISFRGSQGIIWFGRHDKSPIFNFDNVAITGNCGVVFAGRQNGASFMDKVVLKSANWKWIGPTYFDDCVLYIDNNTKTSFDNDIYIRGNSLYGGSIWNQYASGTWNFNGHMYFTGPGFNGMSNMAGDTNNKAVSYFSQRSYSSKTTNFNGPVTIKHNVQFQGNGNQTINFNKTIDGDGSIYFPYGNLNIYFKAANSYLGATVVKSGVLYVQNEGTLGRGAVTIDSAANVQFSNRSDCPVEGVVSGGGALTLVSSSLVFSNDVSIGTLTFDANSSAAFGGAVTADRKLTFPAGAEMTALADATPALTVTNGTVFAGTLRDIDISCDGVITNRGTLAVAHIGANKRLDPIVIDGDAVFENATFEISGIADAMGGTHTVLSVTGAVEGEPTFSFPEGKVYAVTRTGNDWSIEKKAGLVLFVR